MSLMNSLGMSQSSGFWCNKCYSQSCIHINQIAAPQQMHDHYIRQLMGGMQNSSHINVTVPYESSKRKNYC